mmetsp:Transcript_99873/g.250364  ORF Transcript_99873/g.250364 Transcript_99873/m.250364 type:complete len:252 (+) Transcript_99873:65-820(+)
MHWGLSYVLTPICPETCCERPKKQAAYSQESRGVNKPAETAVEAAVEVSLCHESDLDNFGNSGGEDGQLATAAAAAVGTARAVAGAKKSEISATLRPCVSGKQVKVKTVSSSVVTANIPNVQAWSAASTCGKAKATKKFANQFEPSPTVVAKPRACTGVNSATMNQAMHPGPKAKQQTTPNIAPTATRCCPVTSAVVMMRYAMHMPPKPRLWMTLRPALSMSIMAGIVTNTLTKEMSTVYTCAHSSAMPAS